MISKIFRDDESPAKCISDEKIAHKKKIRLKMLSPFYFIPDYNYILDMYRLRTFVKCTPEPAVRMADIREVKDGICKLRKTYIYRNNYIY